MTKLLRIRVPAGQASPAPPVGPALGQAGVNMVEFNKLFNARTAKYKEGIQLPVKLQAYSDRTFEFSIASPPTSWFLKKAAGVEKGAGNPGKEIVGQVTLKQIYAIAQLKQKDENLKRCSLESICKQILGTARTLLRACHQP